jgi:hypothetical protein
MKFVILADKLEKLVALSPFEAFNLYKKILSASNQFNIIDDLPAHIRKGEERSLLTSTKTLLSSILEKVLAHARSIGVPIPEANIEENVIKNTEELAKKWAYDQNLISDKKIVSDLVSYLQGSIQFVNNKLKDKPVSKRVLTQQYENTK